jgi:hypothetical protein
MLTLTLLLTVGEALMLLYILLLINKKETKWTNPVNLLLLFTDLIFSSIIVIAIYMGDYNFFFYLAILLLVISHSFRTADYLFDWREHKFCFNAPLFIVNNLKLTGFVLSLFLYQPTAAWLIISQSSISF